jgi:hypothetical protein
MVMAITIIGTTTAKMVTRRKAPSHHSTRIPERLVLMLVG